MPILRPPGAPPVDPNVYALTGPKGEQFAYVLQRNDTHAYVHYVNTDKRLDEWVPSDALRLADHQAQSRGASSAPTIEVEDENGAIVGGGGSGALPANGTTSRKRKRTPSSLLEEDGNDVKMARSASPLDFPLQDSSAGMTEEEFDIAHHKQTIGAQRNFERVFFGRHEIRTWYWSPYPPTESEEDNAHNAHNTHALAAATTALLASTPGSTPVPDGEAPATSENGSRHGSVPIAPAVPTGRPHGGLPRATIRSHGRTSDLLAGGLGRAGPSGRNIRRTLWVCDRCLKYMTDGPAWEYHCKGCPIKYPPGKKVYQRGAHTIWEIDGAEHKLYCQNLSLFGKLFIDHKTLYFDIERFMFYVLTDAQSQRDHFVGFFSKEKQSFDEYNLACIVTLPPYQRKGFGTLMIEFSYELCRRANQVGTPERPLSDLGLKSYLSFWIGVLIRFLRRLLTVLPPGVPLATQMGNLPDLSTLRTNKARKKKVKGWDGEVAVSSPVSEDEIAFLNQFRAFETRANEDGSATTRVIVRCTLADLARATNLRAEDAAFALQECGLVSQRVRVAPAGDRANGGVAGTQDDAPAVELNESVLIVRETVESIAKSRQIRPPYISLEHVLLP